MTPSTPFATVGRPAARTLVTELARYPGPKTGLLVGVAPDSPVLDAALDAALPDDSLTVVTDDPGGVSDRLTQVATRIRDRVRVVDSLTAAEPADVVVLAAPVTGSAEQVRASLDELSKLTAPGGVVSAAAVAVPVLAPAGADELDRQAALYGVGSDLVLRNLPPLRIHRLRRSTPDPGLAARLSPVDRPSSVPLTPDLRIDSSGVAAAGLTAGLAVLAKVSRPRSKLWLLPAAAALPVAAFFRDPRREPPDDGSLVVAASDGRVLSVERVSDDRFTDGGTADYLRIAVFLSALDVHINRVPVAGRVVDHFLTDGGYAPAMNREAEHNVAAYTVLETPHGRVVVAQRTGLLARRIVHRAPVGSLLARGERFGLIRFGSRTDVYLPADAAEPLVAPDDRVYGGATPIARWLT